MKNFYLLILLISGLTFGQNVVFTGTIFKDKLLSASLENDVAKDVDGNPMVIDANGDGEIQISEALIVSALNISNIGAVHLEGIQNFTNLKSLDANNINGISGLMSELGSLSLLEYLDISQSSISGSGGIINLSPCINLKYLKAVSMLSRVSWYLNDCTMLEFIDLTNSAQAVQLPTSAVHLRTLNLS